MFPNVEGIKRPMLGGFHALGSFCTVLLSFDCY